MHVHVKSSLFAKGNHAARSFSAPLGLTCFLPFGLVFLFAVWKLIVSTSCKQVKLGQCFDCSADAQLQNARQLWASFG